MAAFEKELGCEEGIITDYGNFFVLKNGAVKSHGTCGLFGSQSWDLFAEIRLSQRVKRHRRGSIA